MKYLTLLFKPIKEYPISFLFLAFLLFIPEAFDHIVAGHFYITARIIYHGLFNNIPLAFGITYIILSFIYAIKVFNKKIALILLGAVHFILYSFIVVNLFLIVHFDTLINANILELCDETNPKESSEFINTYVLNPSTYILIFAVLCFGLLEFILSKNINFANSFLPRCLIKKKNFLKIAVLIYVFVSVGHCINQAKYFTFDFKKDIDNACMKPISVTFIFRTYVAFEQYQEEQSYFDRCAIAQKKLGQVECTKSIKYIIIIIGESYNKHHSNLYGYDKNTCPNLSKLDNVYVFDNVITPMNVTSPALKDILSMANADDNTEWCDTPLFPALFKKAGYNVIFQSNQFVKEANMDAWDASCGFFNHPEVEPYIFSFRNSKKFKFDGELINDYKINMKKNESPEKNIIFFHLYGQHQNAAMRFPASFSHFRIDDYQNRKELNEEQKQEVADYDNATLYNDLIVSKIIHMFENEDAIVIYFADHGEEANDYRPHVGRGRGLEKLGASGLRCQMDIPFIVFVSNKFKEQHEETCQRISESVHRPYMTDDLPHMLLDIAEIKTKWFNPKRSIINKQFNSNRRRIIKGISTTVPLDYDKICQHDKNWKIGYKK